MSAQFGDHIGIAVRAVPNLQIVVFTIGRLFQVELIPEFDAYLVAVRCYRHRQTGHVLSCSTERSVLTFDYSFAFGVIGIIVGKVGRKEFILRWIADCEVVTVFAPLGVHSGTQ